MRAPIYRITNDDDPNDYDYPMAANLAQIEEALTLNPDSFIAISALNVGEEVAIGGGAAVQFTIERIR